MALDFIPRGTISSLSNPSEKRPGQCGRCRIAREAQGPDHCNEIAGNGSDRTQWKQSQTIHRRTSTTTKRPEFAKPEAPSDEITHRNTRDSLPATLDQEHRNCGRSGNPPRGWLASSWRSCPRRNAVDRWLSAGAACLPAPLIAPAPALLSPSRDCACPRPFCSGGREAG